MDAPGPSVEPLVRAVSGSALIGCWLGFNSRLTLFSLAPPLGPQAFIACTETSNPKVSSDRLPSVLLSTFSLCHCSTINQFPDNWRRSDRVYPDTHCPESCNKTCNHNGRRVETRYQEVDYPLHEWSCLVVAKYQ